MLEPSVWYGTPSIAGTNSPCTMGHSWDTSGQQSTKHGNFPQERNRYKSKSYVLSITLKNCALCSSQDS